MSNHLQRLAIQNFRSLADVNIELGALNVFFGPNGAGKTTLLDAIWFVRDCERRGVEVASSERSHGIGALNDRAEPGAGIVITLETELAEYEIRFGYSSGRIEQFAGERLYSRKLGRVLIERLVGSDKAMFYHQNMDEDVLVTLREPEKLALTRYLDLEEWSPQAAYELSKLLRVMNFYTSRNADFYRLRKFGSETHYHTHLYDRSQNLWSVLQNLLGKRASEDNYDIIRDFMRRAFPSFDDLVIEQTGPGTVYGSFVEADRRHPIQASGVSDGHLQMLSLLTALFSEGERDARILFDEPEISLHPHAIAVFADAVKLATAEWNKQVFIATHSPVLISQFDPRDILAMELDERGQTQVTRVSDKENIADLLDEYAAGSLYMAEVLAPQSRATLEGAI